MDLSRDQAMGVTCPTELPIFNISSDQERMDACIAGGLPFIVRRITDGNVGRLVALLQSPANWCSGDKGGLLVSVSQLHPGARSGPPFSACQVCEGWWGAGCRLVAAHRKNSAIEQRFGRSS